MQEPDNRRGFYYVSIIDGKRVALALGPFADDHAAALERVDVVRDHCRTMPREPWFAYGTCWSATDRGPGRLNAILEVAQ